MTQPRSWVILMPIPEFEDATENLPPGVYDATLDEVQQRFATNRRRVEIFRGLEFVCHGLSVHGVRAIWVDGSYVTRRLRPSDVDIIFNAPPDYGPHWGLLHSNHRETLHNLHRVDLLTGDTVGSAQLPIPIIHYFQQDRDGNPKGILRVKLAGRSSP